MATPFAVEVASAGFLASARRWISSALDAAGMSATGPSEQVRVRPWSTQLVTPTTEGRVWFKANCSGLTHEAALHAELARIGGGFVDPPLAVHVEYGWLLTRDRGPTLAERGEVTLDQWCALVQEAARLQRHVAGLPIVRDIGVVDCSPVTVLPRFDVLLDRYASLPPSNLCHLSSNQVRAFQAARPGLEEAVAVLTATSLPVTLNHGDLHPGNVLIVDHQPRLFDFADAQWAAAPEVLGAAWGWLVHRTSHPWRKVFDAYREVWSDLITAGDFDELVAAAMLTLPVNRSLTWTYAVAGAATGDLAEWGDAPVSQLGHLLEPWPP
jgi:Phosphotransferase enzyme family